MSVNPQIDLLVRIQAVARRSFPRFIMDRIDPVEKVIREHVNRFATALPVGAVVLDAGAGEARFKGQFSRQRYISIDNCKGDSLWDYAKLNIVGDILHLPLKENSFDAVLNIVVLEHTNDPFQAVSELHRVLRPDGRILVVVPMIWETHQEPNDFFRFTRFGLEALLTKVGFKVNVLLPIGGYFWVVGRYSFYFLKLFRKGPTAILLPLLAPIFGVAIPLVCYYADRISRGEQYTLGYVCEAQKL